ncbi:Bifunctional inhibitor/plant lipid transfer protein/seed storage helical domain-containing protein [Cynara cardunculus var. scolymus]|uniref:Bifunctional inhibitor/plant lipid transfer protein/seed storage helical domain-containing protein n=1 Tax=Cynara cardunculus var. scolymus TaxID=59895 RepID=A0A103Y8H4_CYNCS|nr:Bifunctional inhibitor/plant lipid transfer protein/seed storage helical domain-containing protein [Cynara cardunculus var. scolymus]
MKPSTSMEAYAIAILVMMLAGSQAAMAVTCSVTELSPCLPAFTSSAPPSSSCCAKLKQQSPCLCQYIKNPSLRGYITSPNAKKVSSTCGVPIPKC